MKNSILFFIIILFNSTVSANIPHYLDFKFILNQSDAGKAQTFLKKRLDNGFKTINEKEKDFRRREKTYSTKNNFR